MNDLYITHRLVYVRSMLIRHFELLPVGLNGVPLKSVISKILAKNQSSVKYMGKIGNQKNFAMLKSLIIKFSLHYSLIGKIYRAIIR